MGNPRWTEEEMILAADLANQRGWRGVNSKSPGIAELSEMLRSSTIHPKAVRGTNFRSKNSVSLKANNLIASHPDTLGVGLRTTAAEACIVQQFIEETTRMTKLAQSIRRRIAGEDI